jgi:hypothetical protein
MSNNLFLHRPNDARAFVLLTLAMTGDDDGNAVYRLFNEGCQALDLKSTAMVKESFSN